MPLRTSNVKKIFLCDVFTSEQQIVNFIKIEKHHGSLTFQLSAAFFRKRWVHFNNELFSWKQTHTISISIFYWLFLYVVSAFHIKCDFCTFVHFIKYCKIFTNFIGIRKEFAVVIFFFHCFSVLQPTNWLWLKSSLR